MDLKAVIASASQGIFWDFICVPFLFMLQLEGEIIEVVSMISVLQRVRGMNDQRDPFWADKLCVNSFLGKPTS